MTLEKFNEIAPTLQKEMEKAILQAAKECPEGFLEFVGITPTPKAVEKIRSS